MNKIKHSAGKSGLFLLIIMCFMTITSMDVMASGNASVQLFVEQVFETSDDKVNDTFSYTLEALDAANPMPADSEGQSFKFDISGSETITVGPLVFTNAGEYKYRLTQDIEKEKTGYQYDKMVYDIEVYVINEPSGALKAEVTARNSAGEKVETLTYKNVYKVSSAGKKDNNQPKTTTKTAQTTKSGGTVKTGDNTNVGILLALSGVSLVVMIIGGVYYKRRNA